MEFGFTHRALQPQEQAVIKMGGVVDAIFIENECVGERAQFEEPMPIGRIARETRNLQPQHDAGASEADFGHEALKAFAIRRGARLTQIGVDDVHALDWPAERHRALAKRVLPHGAFGILKHLSDGGLPHVQICITREVARRDLLVGFTQEHRDSPSPEACTAGDMGNADKTRLAISRAASV